MIVVFKDQHGNIAIQECASVVAIHKAIPREDSALKNMFPNGTDGVLLVPAYSNMSTVFVQCSSINDRIGKAYVNGKMDVSECGKCYDAEDWKLC